MICIMESLYLFIILLVFLCLIYLSWQDIKTQEISKNITIFILLIVLFYNLANFFFFEDLTSYYSLVGGLVLGGFSLFCVLVTREKSLGLGDVYLLALLGLVVRLENILLALSILVFTALFFSLIRFRKIDLKKKIPLVPFISLSMLIVFLLDYFLRG